MVSFLFLATNATHGGGDRRLTAGQRQQLRRNGGDTVQFQSKAVNRRFWLGLSQPVSVHRFGSDRFRCHLGLVQVLRGTDSGLVNRVDSVNSGQLSE
ncbi:hypothetical protein HanIR_Chr10g0470181 [Helianthus annuus]|nr:hypothetical protein HanIR_Chr10g0470181 [Helianthus annuus]